jgi:hypothetical protein
MGSIVETINPGFGGGTLTANFSVGAPVTGTPPSEAGQAAGACNVHAGPGTVYIPLAVTDTLTSGSTTVTAPFESGTPTHSNTPLVGGSPLVNGIFEAGNLGGSWACVGGSSNTTPPPQGTFAPQQGVTENIWIIAPGVVNNTTPTFTASANPDWGLLPAADGNSNTLVSVSGPHTMVCGNAGLTSQYFSLLAAPPVTMQLNDGSSLSCRAPQAGS